MGSKYRRRTTYYASSLSIRAVLGPYNIGTTPALVQSKPLPFHSTLDQLGRMSYSMYRLGRLSYVV